MLDARQKFNDSSSGTTSNVRARALATRLWIGCITTEHYRQRGEHGGWLGARRRQLLLLPLSRTCRRRAPKLNCFPQNRRDSILMWDTLQVSLRAYGDCREHSFVIL